MVAAPEARPAVDIVSPQFKADPFPFFSRLRAEEPVCRMVLPDKTPVWLVTRYQDVNALLKDERFAKCRYNALTPEQLRKQPWLPPMFRPLERNMLDLDPPDHTRLRNLVQKAFTPRLVEQMRPRIQSLAEELLDAAARKGRLDIIGDYALPLAMTVITEMLGVPPSDRRRVHKWSKTIVSVNTFNVTWKVFPAIWNFTRYLKRFFELRRLEPQTDLVSALIQAEEAGDKLSKDELLAMALLLLVAGHETTVNLVGNGMLTLMEHREQLEMLREDPTQIHSAVEELLRFTAPVLMATERYPREPVAVAGVTIPRGEVTLGVLGSANRDETVFVDPDRLDLTRQNNRHLAFGQGVHYCVGAPLARMEAEIAINTLLRRAPHVRLQGPVESLRWRRSLILRGMEALPVTW